MSAIFQCAVKLVIIHDEKALLLRGKGNSGDPYWDLPGGRVGDSEELVDAVKRELSEEVHGLNVKNIEGPYWAIREWHTAGQKYMITLFYKAITTGKKLKLSDEHDMHIWVKRNDLSSIEKSTSIRAFPNYLDAIKRVL